MNIVTTTALANLKKNKSRNILIGIAIALTAFLLTMLPTTVMGQLSLQFQAVNELYSPIHGVYRNVDGETADKMLQDETFETVGLREQTGRMYSGDRHIIAAMTAYDETVLKLSGIELKEGTFPKMADEIVVSTGCLTAMGLEGGVGDKIKVPYQPMKKGKLLKVTEKEFTITGMTEDTPESLEKGFYAPMVSEAFAKEIIPEGEHNYEVYFQLRDIEGKVTDEIEERIKHIGEQYGLTEGDIVENSEYLIANYVDVALYTGLGMLLAAIVLAGVLTIHSIYYVSMLDKIQEYGRLRAIGATRRQIRRIVFREGFAVAAIAVPVGIILGLMGGILLIKALVNVTISTDRVLGEEMKVLLANGEASLVKWWIIILAAAVSLLTVYVSLLRPMYKASRITAIQALRCQGGQEGKKKRNDRKGYDELNIPRLTVSNLGRHKRRTAVTITSLGVTGVLFVVTATLCSCMNAEDFTRNEIRRDIKVCIDSEKGDEMHPEWELSAIQQDNPMTEELRNKIEEIGGVTSVETSLLTIGKLSDEKGEGKAGDDEMNCEIKGLDTASMKELEQYIVDGSLDSPSLKDGTGVIVSASMARELHADWKVGDRLFLQVMDGIEIKEREVILAATAEAPLSLMGYYAVMPKEALKNLCSSDITYYWDISVDEGKEDEAAKEIGELIADVEILRMQTFSEVNKQSEDMIRLTLLGCYGILAVFGFIGILNLINTMINSVHVRKKELGMLQAIGMSGQQTVYMLQLEGIFYTAGTLAVSLGFGSLFGYAAYLWAKDGQIMSIRVYHYPVLPVVCLAVIVLAVQMLITYFVNMNFKKLSLIDRIRFAE